MNGDALSHLPVLYAEAMAALNIKDEGRYLDATFGRGGHSQGIMKQLGQTGRLYAMDKDPMAILSAVERMGVESRFVIRQDSFAELDQFLLSEGVNDGIDGVLMDLGVSSPQLDDPERGFSFSDDGPLDMRMDADHGETAAQWLNHAAADEIAYVLKTYGEERFAKRIANAIVARREAQPFTTTADLASVVSAANPRWEKHKNPATRSFQAIRIYINQELDDLEIGLKKAVDALRSGGRLVVISFHSLEDRLVKRFIRSLSQPARIPKRLPVMDSGSRAVLRVIGKPIKPSEQETRRNPRARSAVLRIAEKL